MDSIFPQIWGFFYCFQIHVQRFANLSTFFLLQLLVFSPCDTMYILSHRTTLLNEIIHTNDELRNVNYSLEKIRKRRVWRNVSGGQLTPLLTRFALDAQGLTARLGSSYGPNKIQEGANQLTSTKRFFARNQIQM